MAHWPFANQKHDGGEPRRRDGGAALPVRDLVKRGNDLLIVHLHHAAGPGSVVLQGRDTNEAASAPIFRPVLKLKTA